MKDRPLVGSIVAIRNLFDNEYIRQGVLEKIETRLMRYKNKREIIATVHVQGRLQEVDIARIKGV